MDTSTTRRLLSLMAHLDKLQGVDKGIRDGFAPDKNRLIEVDEIRNVVLQPPGEDLGQDLGTAILQANRPERIDVNSSQFLWDENHVSAIKFARAVRPCSGRPS